MSESVPPELVRLLAACKDEPLSDEPRLVVADWLEEHGDVDRAEFVRLQLRNNGSWARGWRPGHSEAMARERRLARARAAEWLA